MILLKNCELYSPEKQGKKDVLAGGNKILLIDDKIDINNVDKVIDCRGMKLFPGFIDAHVHIAGAGGEGGPASRTPEMQLSMMIEAGVTSVVGCLGTDGFGRDPLEVLMKVKELREQGVSAWMYSGSYQIPTPTIIGEDPGKDITLIDEVIGVGEIALSDHRSSNPTTAELVKLTEHARVGGMLGGKAGIVNIHMGDAKNPFNPLYDAVKNSELPYKQFLPTHCNRNNYIFEDAKEYGKNGYVDLTSSSYPYFPEYEIKPSKAIVQLLEAGVPIEHITMTSDACGSLPDFDKDGNLISLEMGLLTSLFKETTDTIKEGLEIEKAIKPVTTSIADALKLKNKGRIEKNKDADLILVDNNYNLKYVIAMGQLFMENGKLIKKGAYER